MEQKKFLRDSSEHFSETHERWLNKFPLNRNIMSPDYKEEWIPEQCFKCQFYIKLTGLFGMDWGVCSNKASHLDGRVMFEHDGCEFFTFAEDELEF